MKRYGVAAMCAAVLALGGCNESGPDIDRVQTNLVDKAIFQGEWWYSSSVVDTDFDETNAIGGFSGSMQFIDLGLDAQGATFTMARIRWVVDQNYLYAYRAYELIDGGNDDGRSPDFRGQPLAAFAISSHVDVRQDYNPATGELTNVRVENSSDRRWYQRQFMRVDWSQNLISPFYAGDHEFSQLAGYYEPLSVPFFFEAGAHADFPASYAPKFVRVKDDPDYRFAAEWPAADQDTVHFMSFVTQQVWSPGTTCFQQGSPCTSVAVTVRNSFLRVPTNHEYASLTATHAEWDRFGLFRQNASTYIRGGKDEESLSRRCTDDTDCGGGTCDTATHICVGGLTSDYGETDFMTWYRPMHNFYSDSLQDRTCVADWQCDGRYDDTPGTAGSYCDRAAHRCTIPVADRPLRRVAYHLSPHFPAMYSRSAFQTIGLWNEVFMRGLRAVKGSELPSGPNQACQSADPTQYCYCKDDFKSAEVLADNTCPYKYDPFEAPTAAMGHGVVAPYDCYIQGPADLAHPTSFDAYGADAYGYTFVGGECAFVLKANSCDVDPTRPCEELGDIRYQFFNFLPHGLSAFGVSIPMSDPKTGELITSNANIGAEFMEYQGGMALGYFPMLRGEITEESFFENEQLRGYSERRGRVEHPAALAASGTDGFSVGDTSRPGLPTDLHGLITNRMDQIAPSVERLRGSEGRAMINSDRLRLLAGTDHEQRIMEAMGQDALTDLYGQDRVTATTSVGDADVMSQISPFRDGLQASMDRDRREENWLSSHNYCRFDARLYGPSFYKYWAEAFRGYPNEEANIRVRQLTVRGVMLHEMGHSIGLRHNFAGSYDRNNYYDGYFQIARDLPLPNFSDFDANMDGNVEGEEANAYYAELRRVRNLRTTRGLGNTSSGSIMDYPGDTADWSGRLARYDDAAVLWGYFNRAEAYVGDPRISSTDTNDGLYQADRGPRTLWTYYRGGDACNEDVDCPFVTGSSQLAEGQAIAQRCVTNPRYTRDPRPCEGTADCVCSNFYEDFRDYLSGPLYSDTDGDGRPDAPAYDNDADGDRELDHLPVRYLFCSDERTDDISWCSRFDAGESFRESVDHFRREWEDNYPNNYFRRYLRGGARGAGTIYGIQNGVKIFQHFFFRYFYEPAFRSDAGPLGVEDQYIASVDIMNWLAEILGAPDVGSYTLDATTNNYRFMGNDLRMAGSSANVATGLGFNLWSAYQTGLNGFFRRERAGTFTDKLWALYAFARRDWSLGYTIDERFYINFYNLFPLEVTELFGGYIQRDPREWAPRMQCTTPDDCRLQYMNLWRSSYDCGPRRDQPCRGDNDSTYTAPSVDGASPEVLRQWATMLALAEFPVFYDTTFEQRLVIYKLNNGDGWTRPGAHADGTPFCEYGAAGCTDPDYVQYTSDRFHTTYVANVIRSRIEYNLPEEQVGYRLLRRLVDRQNEIRRLTALPTPTMAERDLLRRLRLEQERDDSYLELLIDIQRRYGISSYL